CSLLLSAACFERAVLCPSLPDKRIQFRLAGDRVRRFEFSLERQRSRIAADIADRKFHRARKRHRVLVSRRPLRLRGFPGPPSAQHWIQQQESALTVVLSVKAQRALVPFREIKLHLPTAGHIWRLGLSHGREAGLDN